VTLLSVIQSAADEINLPPVTQVIGNQDQTVRGLLRAFVKEGRDLLQEDPPWSALINEYTFDTVDQQEEYAFPQDYQRMINNTAWDRNQFWQIRGGITPQQWQVIRSGLYQTARLSSNFRIKQGSDKISKAFYLDPIPTSARTLVFEYQSKWWLYDPDNANQRLGVPTADTNGIIFDDELVARGVVWRFLSARNLPFLSELEDYRQYRKRSIAQDRSPPTLTVNEQPWRLPIGNVPDTGFGIT